MRRVPVLVVALAVSAAACGRDKAVQAAAADTLVFLPNADTSVKPAGTPAVEPQVPAPAPVVVAVTPTPPPPKPIVTERPPRREPDRPAPKNTVKTLEPAPTPTRAEAIREEPKPPTVAPPKPTDALRTIVVNTNPRGARVRVQGTGAADTASGQTPAILRVPPGVFTYEIEMPNYVAERSRQRKIDVSSKLADTISVTLTPVDREGRLERADSLFRDGKCPEAITVYQSVAAPPDMSGAAGARWLESRLRVGQCYRKTREYEKAQQTFEQVLAAEPGQWAAKYTLGLTHCDRTKYPEGIQVLREMGGQFIGLVASEKKAGVRALSQYAMALCNYQDLISRPFPDRHPELRERAVGGFEEFVQGAEALLKGNRIGDAALHDGVTKALADAKSKLRSLSGS